MTQEMEPGINALEIGRVREATFDPQVGETALLGVYVRESVTQRAASDTEVIFATGAELVRVKTDDGGWAFFPYKAEQPGDVAVTASLQGVKSKAASHNFHFEVLAAGVWDVARIQLNNEPDITTWGERAKFPRTQQVHTIKLIVDDGSSLLGREIRLALTGYSSPSELNITSVQPALGVNRLLTSAGLQWQLNSTKGGAYNLQLEASRILKLSPGNAMSLGPVTSEEVTGVS